MLTPTPFYYLRHGETDWNLAGRIQGGTDVPLNATGAAQAEAAAVRLAAFTDIATICASPLARAYATALAVQRLLDRPLKIVDDLGECRWGAWEGHYMAVRDSGWPEGAVPPGGEGMEDFIRRALGGVNAALAEPGPVLIVAHGGVFRAIKRYAGLEASVGSLGNAEPQFLEPLPAELGGWRVTPL